MSAPPVQPHSSVVLASVYLQKMNNIYLQSTPFYALFPEVCWNELHWGFVKGRINYWIDSWPRSQTLWVGFFSLAADISHHTWQLTHHKILPSRNTHVSQPWNNGHCINPYNWDFCMIIKEAVYFTVCLITVPFERPSHWGMDTVSSRFSAFEEENTSNAL